MLDEWRIDAHRAVPRGGLLDFLQHVRAPLATRGDVECHLWVDETDDVAPRARARSTSVPPLAKLLLELGGAATQEGGVGEGRTVSGVGGELVRWCAHTRLRGLMREAELALG